MYNEACKLEGKIVEGRIATPGESHEITLQAMLNFETTILSQCL